VDLVEFGLRDIGNGTDIDIFGLRDIAKKD